MTAKGLCEALVLVVLGSNPSLYAQQVFSHPQPAPMRSQIERLGRGSLCFIENRGQFNPDVKFQAKSSGKILWFTSRGMVFDVPRPIESSQPEGLMHGTKVAMFPGGGGSEPSLNGKFERLVFSEDFENGSASPKIEASAAEPGIYNYFIGNDPKNWRTRVLAYSQLLYHDVWPGIDVRFIVKGAEIEQEFVVHPGADASRIQVAYRGVGGLQIAKDGSLIVQTPFGPFREGIPSIYQEISGLRVPVSGSYAISGEFAYTFKLGSYRSEQSLVIDPTLLYSTYIGSSGSDSGGGIAVDSAGNAYMGGTTQGGTYPTTPGVFQVTCPSAPNCQAAVVSKFDALGRLSYSTFLGSLQGSSVGGDTGRGIAVNSAGEAYITGLANGGFPTTTSAFQTGCSGSSFMAKLNSTGTALLYSTCLGSEGFQAENGAGAYAVALDAAGRAYMTGMTTNAGSLFPTTGNAYQSTLAGSGNAFVAIIDPSLSGASSLVYSTYLGGEITDIGCAIAVDAYGSAYVTGSTFSFHFPITTHAFQRTNPKPFVCGTCGTAFVAKLNPTVSGSSGLIYSSYLGGNDTGAGDFGYGVAVDGSGSAYVVGTTGSTNFPTTTGAFESSTTCTRDGFVTKVSAGGAALIYSTFLTDLHCGGATGAAAIALDSSGNAYVVGGTTSPTFPITPDAFQNTKVVGGNYGYDAFLSELNASGSALIYSTFLGGNGDDGASGAAIDATGDVYITGATYSTDFPTTLSAFQLVSGGAADAFVTKFPLGAPGGLSITGVVPNSGGNAGTVSARIIGSGFHAGATGSLSCGGTSNVSASNLNVTTGGRTGSLTFDLVGIAPGLCNVVVTNPDGGTTTLANGFNVQPGGAASVSIQVVGRSFIRGGTSQQYLIIYSNSGNVDAYLAPVWIKIPNYVEWSIGGGIRPPPVPVGVPIDWRQVPPQIPNGPDTVIPLLISEIAAGSSGIIELTLTAPDAPQYAHQIFDVQAWVTEPWIITPPQLLSSQIAGSTSSGTNIPSWFNADWFNCITAIGNALGPNGGCAQEIAAAGISTAEALVGLVLSKQLPADTLLSVTQIVWSFTKPVLVNCGQAVIADATGYGEIVTIFDFVLNGVGAYSACQPCFQPLVSSLLVKLAVLILTSGDPNDKTGLPGVGAQRYVSGAEPFVYAVAFGNEATATAPAQTVVITDPLPRTLDDLTTVSIGPIGFGNQLLLPPAGASYSTVVDLRPQTNLLVGVNSSFDPSTGQLAWTFTSLDPVTGQQTTDPTAGFLPPGGNGSVSFTVMPKQSGATGTQVSNQAAVVFDSNAPISTPIWINTIDYTSPVSHVSALPATSTCPAFRVNWSGSDVGSGLQGFTVFVSDTGGAFTPWISYTKSAAADYIGSVGHAYSFYSIASDLTGNHENGKTSAEASTAVTATGPCGPPSLSGLVSNFIQSGTTVTATLTLTNTGFTAAQAININQMTFRTLSGSGTVTLASPALPAAEGTLVIGASMTVPVTLNVPATVTRFSMTESGNLQDGSGNNYSYSMAQTVIP